LNTLFKGHLLQLIPFFLYLLQHLLLGFIQFEAQPMSQLSDTNVRIGVTFCTCL